MTDDTRLTRAEVLTVLGIASTSLSRNLHRTRTRTNAGLPLRPWDVPLPGDDSRWSAEEIAAVAVQRVAMSPWLAGGPEVSE